MTYMYILYISELGVETVVEDVQKHKLDSRLLWSDLVCGTWVWPACVACCNTCAIPSFAAEGILVNCAWVSVTLALELIFLVVEGSLLNIGVDVTERGGIQHHRWSGVYIIF